MNQRLRVLQYLGVQIERLAGEATPSAVGPCSRRRRLLPLVIALALLAFAAAALAATGVFETGAAVRTGVGDLTHAGSGFGGVRPRHVSGILAQSADPAGGPSWGIRVIGTTRGVACLQVGRVVNGQLGVLGQDGLFHDDGRFHPLPAAVTTPSDGCFAPDAAGNLFTAVEDASVPASGLSLRFSAPPAEKTIAPPGGCSNGDLQTPQKLPTCPAGDERSLYYGMLGPQVTSITYVARGERHTVATGKGGAYLIVLTASKLLGGHGSSLTPLPGAQPIRQITYRNRAACDIPDEAAGKACPAVGYQAVRLPLPDQVAATLHVTYPIGPPPADTGGPRLHGLAVQFTARVAITSAQTGYVLVLQRCGGGSFGVGTRTNIAAGEHVTLRLAAQTVGPCLGGNYTGAVYYVDELGHGLPPGLILPGRAKPAASLGLGGDVLVGRFAFAAH